MCPHRQFRAWLLLAACGLSLCAPSVFAQDMLLRSLTEIVEDGELETDRDSFTPATSTVGRTNTVVEASYSFIDNRTAPDAHSFPELLIRHGLTKRLELRCGWNYEAGGPTAAVAGADLGDEDFGFERASKLLYGFKYQQTAQVGWVPESALIVEGYTPTSGPSRFSRLVAAQVFGWTTPNKWKVNSSLRYGLNNDDLDSFNQWAPSTVLKIPLGERWAVHAEYFGVISSNLAKPIDFQFASFGTHVLLTSNLELGMRFGFGLNEQTPRFFNNVGIGWRF